MAFLRSLASQLPEAEIVLAVPADVAPIYRLQVPFSGKLISFERGRLHAESNYRKEIALSFGNQVNDWLILPAFNLDKATLKLSRMIPAKRRIAFRGEMRGVRFWHRWMHQRGISEKVDVPDPDLHELEKYRLLLQHLGLKPEIALPSIRARNSARTKRNSLSIVLAVGTVNPIKEYPRWPEVVSALNEKLDPRWVLIGGAGENIPRGLLDVLPPQATSNLVGKTSLDSLVDEIAEADAYLGVDTGPAHVALALGKPAVVVLGGGDYGRFFPYGNARVVAQRMDCFHCHWECRYERARCLHEIPPESVVHELVNALSVPERKAS